MKNSTKISVGFAALVLVGMLGVGAIGCSGNDQPFNAGVSDPTTDQTVKDLEDKIASMQKEIDDLKSADSGSGGSKAPTLIGTTPEEGAKFYTMAATKDVSFEMVFSEAMDDASLSGIHFVRHVSGGSDETIAAAVTLVSDTTYDAKATLAPGNYTLVIPGGSSADAAIDFTVNLKTTINCPNGATCAANIPPTAE